MYTKRKLFIFSLAALVALIIIITFKITNTKLEENVYIMFNSDVDSYQKYDWSRHKDKLPHDFNPSEVYTNIVDIESLNDSQKHYYDSVRKTDFIYPRKVIKKEKGKKDYYIAISSSLSIKLQVTKDQHWENCELTNYNIISIDSFVKLFPELEYKKPAKNRNLKFNLIEASLNSAEAKCIRIHPTIIEYN